MTYLIPIINLIFLQVLLFFSFIDRKNIKRILFFIGVSILCIILLALLLNVELILPLFGLPWNITFSLITAINIILIIPISLKKVHTSLTIIFPFIFDLIVKALGSMFFQLPFSEMNRIGYFYFSFPLFSIQIFLDVFVFVIYNLMNHVEKYHENKYEFFVIIGLISIELIAYLIINFNLSSLIIVNQNAYVQVVLLNAFLIFLLVVTLVSFYLLQKRIKLKYQQINSYKEELLEKNYQDIYIETQEELLKLRHDMANMIDSIKTYESAEILAMKNELSKKIQEQKFYYTKNKLLNSILVNKIDLAKKKGILVETNITIDRKLNISNIDCISLFSNLLDNSIEALEKEIDKRLIINIGTTENTLEIQITNSCKTIQKTKKENPHYHGFGLKIINEIVNKYDGNYSSFLENNMFSSVLILKC